MDVIHSDAAAGQPAVVVADRAPASRVLVRIGLLLIRAYQVGLGPALVGSCRFEPSCSRYASEALVRHGLLRGSWLAVKRLARCRPFGGAGFDPVPPALQLGGPSRAGRSS